MRIQQSFCSFCCVVLKRFECFRTVPELPGNRAMCRRPAGECDVFSKEAHLTIQLFNLAISTNFNEKEIPEQEEPDFGSLVGVANI